MEFPLYSKARYSTQTNEICFNFMIFIFGLTDAQLFIRSTPTNNYNQFYIDIFSLYYTPIFVGFESLLIYLGFSAYIGQRGALRYLTNERRGELTRRNNKFKKYNKKKMIEKIICKIHLATRRKRSQTKLRFFFTKYHKECIMYF